MEKLFLAALTAAVCFLSVNLEAYDHHGYDHSYHGNYYHHDRVYVGDPWYHPHHVVFVDGGYYPHYYAGYPYYYYAPQYYYNPDPSLNVNVHIGG